MRNLLIITTIFLCFLASGCGKKLEMGRELEGEYRKMTPDEIVLGPESFAGDTLRVRGTLENNENSYFLRGSEDSILILPVGFTIPDSALGGRSQGTGMVYYDEERRRPALALERLTVRLAWRRPRENLTP